MSDWYMGKLARQDQDVADAYAQQEEMQRRAYAFPRDAIEPPAMGALYNPNEMAALRVRNAVRPISGEGRTESEESRAAYNDPYMGALELGLTAVPFSKPLRTGAVAGGALLASTGGAEAGPIKKAGDVLKGFAPGTILKPGQTQGVLGMYPQTTAQKFYDETMKGGYSVNLPTGDIPKEGLMVGKYKNTDPRNVVVPKAEFTPADVERHVATNARELGRPETYLGGWMSPEDKAYLDVSQRFAPDKIRVATKSGERTGQLAGYNVGAGESFPIGNWRNFVGSPEFRGRMDEMAGVGREYLNQFPTKEWWDMHGSSFERAYGSQNLPQVAGFSAATAPVSNPYDNMRAMSEYMRRHIKGEPTIQPGFRIPEGGMGPWSAGKQIPLEQSRIANLEKAAAGNLDALQRAKVREEAKAMSGDQSAVVLDRHWARITEDPSRGIFAGAQEGVIDTATRKRGVGDYDFVKGHVSDAARAANRSPRDYSADVWTGIRETIKRTNQLFGTPFRGSAITGESKSYQDIFQELLEKKAKHMGISTDELDDKLKRGDANLLSTMLATPALWGAYQAWRSGQGGGETPIGSLADQSGYQRM